MNIMVAIMATAMSGRTSFLAVRCRRFVSFMGPRLSARETGRESNFCRAHFYTWLAILDRVDDRLEKQSVVPAVGADRAALGREAVARIAQEQ